MDERNNYKSLLDKKKMKRLNVIVCETKELYAPEVYGNFKKMCEAKGFPYHSLKMLKFPIFYNNYIIHKVEFK
jgi:hypothetical protein